MRPTPPRHHASGLLMAPLRLAPLMLRHLGSAQGMLGFHLLSEPSSFASLLSPALHAPEGLHPQEWILRAGLIEKERQGAPELEGLVGLLRSAEMASALERLAPPQPLGSNKAWAWSERRGGRSAVLLCIAGPNDARWALSEERAIEAALEGVHKESMLLRTGHWHAGACMIMDLVSALARDQPAFLEKLQLACPAAAARPLARKEREWLGSELPGGARSKGLGAL